jgi:hypothetical protein
VEVVLLGVEDRNDIFVSGRVWRIGGYGARGLLVFVDATCMWTEMCRELGTRRIRSLELVVTQ